MTVTNCDAVRQTKHTNQHDEIGGTRIDTRPPMPRPGTIYDENIPAAMKDAPRWVTWVYDWREGSKGKPGKYTKKLTMPGGAPASSIDPDTWSTFAEVAEAFLSGPGKPVFAGIGFVLGDGWSGVDFDKVRNKDTGELHPDAVAMIARLDTYGEVSPSGTGVKVFGRGTWDAHNKYDFCGNENALEFYGDERFFTVTGEMYGATDVRDIQPALDALAAELPQRPKKAGPTAEIPPCDAATDEKDNDLIDKIRGSAQGGKFDEMWANRTTTADLSSDNFAMVSLLAWWVGPYPEHIDRLFRKSGQMRPKWDEPRGKSTWGAYTIANAIARQDDYYHGTGFYASADWTPPPPPAAGPTGGQPAARPELRIIDGRYDAVGCQVREALAEAPNVYLRETDEMIVTAVSGPDGVCLRETTEPALLVERVAAVRSVVVETKKGTTPAQVPMSVAKAVMADPGTAGDWRRVRAVVRRPVLGRDGRLIAAPGYDAETRLIVDCPTGLVNVPDAPTLDDAKAAVVVLRELVGEFPFEEDSDEMAWLAMLLTPLARELYIGPTPLMVVDATAAGSGKTLLCQVISAIVDGAEAEVSSAPQDDTELRKRLTAIAIRQQSLALIDNLDEPLDGGPLDAIATATKWTDRVLGSSRIVSHPWRTCVFVTGNNVRVVDDTRRRVLMLRLNPECENPAHRTGFAIANLPAHVAEHRGRYLSAALTILRGYVTAGRPAQTMLAMGSFEGWSEVVRGALIWAGLYDVGMCVSERRESADPQRDAIDVIMSKVHLFAPPAHRGKGGPTWTVADLLARVYPRLDERSHQHVLTADKVCADLVAAVLVLSGGKDGEPSTEPKSIPLGRRLRAKVGAVINGHRLTVAGTTGGTTRYRVETVTTDQDTIEDEFNTDTVVTVG